MANYVSPKMDDFKQPDGNTDWSAYTKAQVASGERCSKCGSYILFGSGYPQECSPCKHLQDDKDEVTHDDLVRCPACGRTFDPRGDDYEVYSEGENDVTCPSCEREFTITTEVSYSFTSPARLEEKAAEDEEGGEVDEGEPTSQTAGVEAGGDPPSPPEGLPGEQDQASQAPPHEGT